MACQGLPVDNSWGKSEMTKNNNKIKTEHRITTLEANYGFIKKSVNRIDKKLDNHINCIYKKVSSIKTWLVSVLVSVILLLLALIFNLVR